MLAVFRGDEERLTLGKVCSRVEVNISTGHRWRLTGKLQTYKIGGRHFVSRDAWERFIERCNGGSNPTKPGVPGARTAAQRRRDDERAARQCEAMGV